MTNENVYDNGSHEVVYLLVIKQETIPESAKDQEI